MNIARWGASTAALGAVMLISLSAVPAQADPIAVNSSLSLNGADGYDPRSIDFFGPANIVRGSGSFIGLGTCTGCVTMIGSLTPFTEVPFTLYTASNNGLTSTMEVTSDFLFLSPTGGRQELSIVGTGILTLTGFDAAPGLFFLRTAGKNANTVFSLTADEDSLRNTSAVPEPASLSLLGCSLGLLVVRRYVYRRRQG